MNHTIHLTNVEISSFKDYIALMKPRVMSLVVFTGLIGMMLAPGSIHPLIACVSILSIVLAASSAAAINMWYDRDIDKLMLRTNKRPIVSGRVDADNALAFGIILGLLSFIIMGLCVNIYSAFLLIFTIGYYILIYTVLLKRSSIYNVVIGGVSGAMPPLIGWVSVTNSIDLEAVVLFLIIFFWTPPHSWALVMYRLQDYKNCQIPMLPVRISILKTNIQIILYSIAMIISTLLPFLLNFATLKYLLISSILNIIFLYYVISLFKSCNIQKSAKKFFFYSIVYLFLIFFSLILK